MADTAEQEAERLQAVLAELQASHAASHGYYSRELAAATDDALRVCQQVEAAMARVGDKMREEAGRHAAPTPDAAAKARVKEAEQALALAQQANKELTEAAGARREELEAEVARLNKALAAAAADLSHVKEESALKEGSASQRSALDGRLEALGRELAEEKQECGRLGQEVAQLHGLVAQLRATVEVDEKELAQDRALLLKGKTEREALKKELAAAQKVVLKHAACGDKLSYLQVRPLPLLQVRVRLESESARGA